MIGLAVLAVGLLGPAWKSDPHEIILHRSAGMAAPENTVPALVEAVRQGADGVEIDIRRTLDGTFVLYHDDWVFLQHGPGRLIEDMTTEEVRSLDVGVRWGTQWKGLRAPLLRDVLRFAKQNQLLLFLDIKTRGIDEPLRDLLRQTETEDLVIVPDRMRTSARALPWVQGWNYLDGGEESLDEMRRVAALMGPEPRRAMVDDARGLAIALGRRPRLRRIEPYQDTWNNVQAAELSADASRALAARRAIAQRSAGELARLAEDEKADPKLRLEAMWELGSRRGAAIGDLMDRLFRAKDAEDPRNHPSGMPFFDTFRRAGAAAALARHGDWNRLASLADLKLPFGRAAIGLSWASFGGPIAHVGLALPNAEQPAIGLALGHALVHPHAFEYCLAAAAQTSGYDRRTAVFWLAKLDEPASARLAEVVRSGSEAERRAAAQALYWRETPEAARARQTLVELDLPADLRRILSAPRT